jgi:hypothetical protein
MSIDYQAELKRLEEFSGDFWKPKAGQHKVKALTEIMDAEAVKFGDEPDAELQLRAQIKVEVAGKEFLWNFPKGKTPASTFGQLVKYGVVKGKLTGQEFIVVVVGEGQNIRFTIVA